MKTLCTIVALLVASTEQVTLKRAGFIDCEMTGSCAPKKVSNAPEGFVSGVDIGSLYSSTEQDDTK